MTTALVIGAGPAGLMAAQTLALAGVDVRVIDKMPSVGRKFLMAGKSGLNITKAEALDDFQSAYHVQNPTLSKAIDAFGPDAVQAWARHLGQDIFTGSTGRVFPKVMKASPLLRAWLARLSDLGVQIQTRWRWTGWDETAATFDTSDGVQLVKADITILALGGASWSRLGSDGAWAAHMPDLAPFAPANVGIMRHWSDHMAKHIGQPVKGIALQAGPLRSRGEIILSSTGIEGGGIYEVSRGLRDGHPLIIDLVPDLTIETLNKRWADKSNKVTTTKFLKNGLRLPAIKIALFHEMMQSGNPSDMPSSLKALPIGFDALQPLDGAISTAGGVRFSALDENFMLRARPGVFCAGEMLDWEAPTGGYLINGCLATGQAAGLGALDWANSLTPDS